MISVTHHIQRVRAHPHHIRRQIAFTLAAGATALIAFIWLVGNIATGNFAAGTSSFGDIAKTVQEVIPETSGGSLVGAVGAVLTPVDSSPRIQVLDVRTSSTLDASKAAPEPTILPF